MNVLASAAVAIESPAHMTAASAKECLKLIFIFDPIVDIVRPSSLEPSPANPCVDAYLGTLHWLCEAVNCTKNLHAHRGCT